MALDDNHLIIDPLPDAETSRIDEDIEALVTAYAGVITRAVRRVAGVRAPAVEDDVHQAVIVGLWQQLRRGQTITHPASYGHSPVECTVEARVANSLEVERLLECSKKKA